MRVETILDDIEQTISAEALTLQGRWQLLSWLSFELNELSGKADWDWNLTYLDPAIQTITGQTAYMLPEDFGINFSRQAGTSGTRYACKLDNGTSQSTLTYESPKQYFSRDLGYATNSVPSNYTIMAATNARRQLYLYPPPDANGSVGYYMISGLYPRTDWKLDEMQGLPAVPANSSILKYAVLRRLNPKIYEAKYLEALGRLMLAEAQNRQSVIFPADEIDGVRTSYDATRRRRF